MSPHDLRNGTRATLVETALARGLAYCHLAAVFVPHLSGHVAQQAPAAAVTFLELLITRVFFFGVSRVSIQ